MAQNQDEEQRLLAEEEKAFKHLLDVQSRNMKRPLHDPEIPYIPSDKKGFDELLDAQNALEKASKAIEDYIKKNF